MVSLYKEHGLARLSVSLRLTFLRPSSLDLSILNGKDDVQDLVHSWLVSHCFLLCVGHSAESCVCG